MQIQPTQNYSLKSNSSQQNPSFQKLIERTLKPTQPYIYNLSENKGIRKLVELLEKYEGRDLIAYHNYNDSANHSFGEITLNTSGPHGTPFCSSHSHLVNLYREELEKFNERIAENVFMRYKLRQERNHPPSFWG